MEEHDDLDDILSAALDEVVIEEDKTASASLQTAASKTAALQQTGAEAAKSQAAANPGDELEELFKLFTGEGGGDLAKVLDEAFKDLDLSSLMDKLGGDNPDAAGLEEAMKMLQGKDGEPGGGGIPSEMLEKVMSKIEADLGEEGIENMMKGMMKKFMAKEVMYEPIKKITEEFPKYLDTHPGLAKDDRARYTSMLGAYRALLKAYDDEPENVDQIARILHDVQQFGEPPAEIVKILQPTGGADGAAPPACPTQ